MDVVYVVHVLILLILLISLVFAVSSMLSIKFIVPLVAWAKIEFTIKGEMLMSLIMMGTGSLVTMGVCGDRQDT